ncbi:flavoprotein [Croceivirga lutea]|uniref:NAD(P)/FAD-dependent oxidoreductase n=1 Tax=Croceivirga lutea TaxID=1775167 RepID=UPI00163B4DE5|nr:NAD(P)/FAD-dependent oxidoreductase [Croceivirga lutea]GGG36285.1 flavoprotein [Croceivirga lutea]
MFDVIVVGGGAAGFYAAINIAEAHPGASIAIFERGKTVLGKVKVSGGGRCNVTHAEFLPKELAKNYPRGEKELLGPFHQYMTGDVISFFEQRGVPLKIEEDGRIFPQSNSSQTIIDCFLVEAERLNIRILKNSQVKDFEHSQEEDVWKVVTANKAYFSQKIVLATGSSSKIWDKLKLLGHTISKPVPSLFTFNIQDKRLKGNQGISANAYVEIKESKVETKSAQPKLGLHAEGPVLITHWGLSGPAILKLSAWGALDLNKMGYVFKIIINWLPEYNLELLLAYFMEVKKQTPKKTILRTKAVNLPQRLWISFCRSSDISEGVTWADVSKATLHNFAEELTQGEYQVAGKSTFKEEFVTAGGVDLKEIDFKTYKSKLVPGLYFAGEILNIDAITGGFNFQNAWTSAYIAAQDVAASLAQR